MTARTVVTPMDVESILVSTAPLTESAAFTPHAHGTSPSRDRESSASPLGNGIPRRKPRGAIRSTDISARMVSGSPSVFPRKAGMPKRKNTARATMPRLAARTRARGLRAPPAARLPNPEEMSRIVMTIEFE
jgi:hypothetical protein